MKALDLPDRGVSGIARSVRLQLFQERSTLGQQLAHTLSLRQGLSEVESIAFIVPAPNAPALLRYEVRYSRHPWG
jgi:hypothetical protein